MDVIFLMLSISVLLAGATMGAALLRAHWQRKQVPFGLAVAHGVTAATGVLLLIIAIRSGHGHAAASADRLWLWPKVILGLFLAVATGGVVMLYFHLRHRHVPLAIAAVHASGAVLGIAGLLVVFALRSTAGITSPAPAPAGGAQQGAAVTPAAPPQQ